MNEQVLPHLGANFTISNRPSPIAVWQSGAGEHDSPAIGNRSDLVASVPGKGPPATRPDQKDHRLRCQAVGARSAFAGIIEALRCAFGKSKDRAFGNYVMHRRDEIHDHLEVVVKETLHSKEKIT
jgi:hypothetical protein